MVASPSVRRLPAVAALAICLMFIVPPSAAQVDTPTPPSLNTSLYDVSLNASSVVLSSGGKAGMFFNGGQTVTLSAQIFNTGSAASPDNTVPGYFWLRDTSDRTINQCYYLPVVPAARADPATGALIPGSNNVSYSFVLPRVANVYIYNVSFYVNTAPETSQRAGIAPCKTSSGAARPSDYTVPSPSASTGGATGTSDHTKTLPLVRDLRLDYQVGALTWCTSAGAQVGTAPAWPNDASTCTPIGPANQVNVTTMKDNDQVTFFKVDIRNYGNYTSPLDPTGTPWKIPYNLTVSGHGIGPGYDPTDARPTTIDAADAGTGGGLAGNFSVVVGYLDLNHTYGNYATTFRLNSDPSHPERQLAMRTTDNKIVAKTFEVAWYDFVAGLNATDFAYDAAHAYPFPFDAGQPHVTDGILHIIGNVSIQSLGPAAPAADAKPDLLAWIDSPTGPFVYNVTKDHPELYGPLGSRTRNNASYVKIDISASSIATNSLYLAPGVHTLHVEVDDHNTTKEGKYFESDEENDWVEIPIYVMSNDNPVIYEGPYLTENANPVGTANNANVTSRHPREAFTLRVYASEGTPTSAGVATGDTAHLSVVANFSRISNASQYFVQPLAYSENSVNKDKPVFIAGVTNLSFLGNGTSEDLKITIEARDPFGHAAVPNTAGRLLLEKWPVQSLNDTDILTNISTSQETRSDWAAQDSIEVPYEQLTPVYQLRVYNNWTGFISGSNNTQDQLKKTENLHMTFYPPANASPIETDFISMANCQSGTLDSLPHQARAGNPWNTTCVPTESNYHFHDIPPVATPGKWGAVINITDASGETRHIFRNFTMRDSPPQFNATTLTDISNKEIGHNANAGDTVQVHLNVSDDFDVSRVFVNWTRKGDNATTNLTMSAFKPGAIDSGKAYTYNDTFKVGRGLDLPRAGQYLVTFVAEDSNGNWNSSAPIEFALNETVQPVFNQANSQTGADPASQELKAPVTFYAHVASQFDPRVVLTVSRDGVIVPDLDGIPLNVTSGTGQDQNFTYTTTFNLSGTYHYKMSLFGSASTTPSTSFEGDVLVSENLGPRIQIRSPAVKVREQYYAPAAPLLSFLAYDAQGVDNTTFNLTVNGVHANTVITPAPAGGYYFEYTVPNSEGLRFVDGQVVPVNITVADLTGLDPTKTSLTSWLNFTFIVDAKPPSAKITEFTPRYKAGSSSLYNVSLATAFTIVSSNDDDSPVPVERVMYTIAGGGRSVTSTYTGPFTLADNKDVYAGATVYTISVWAVDAVGNSNVTHPAQYAVFLDDQSPHLAVKLTQGRYVNLTIVDDQTGVKSVTLWSRIDAGDYHGEPMTKDAVGDVWRGLLPEATRGQTLYWYAQAVDNVDNNGDNTDSFGSAAVPFDSYKVPNHEPTIKLTSPTLGSIISKAVDIAWTASDADNDRLSYTVFSKAPGKESFEELAKLDGTDARKYSLDTSKLPDGEYTFRVSVSDGSVSKSDETTVTLINSASAFGAVSNPGTVLPGDTVVLTAFINKADATVEAQLYRGTSLVASYTMNDLGHDGDAVAGDHTYSARIPVPDSGDYSVTIVAHYQQNGTQVTDKQANAATFSAKLTPGYIVATYAGLLVLLGLLAIIGIALAVFVVMRRKV